MLEEDFNMFIYNLINILIYIFCFLCCLAFITIDKEIKMIEMFLGIGDKSNEKK